MPRSIASCSSGGHVRQHRDAAADVEAADADRDARGAQRPGDIDGARELIGLHADQADQSAASAHCASAR